MALSVVTIELKDKSGVWLSCPNGNRSRANIMALSDALEKLQDPDMALHKARRKASNGAPMRQISGLFISS